MYRFFRNHSKHDFALPDTQHTIDHSRNYEPETRDDVPLDLENPVHTGTDGRADSQHAALAIHNQCLGARS
jgi:hypothetical protein